MQLQLLINIVSGVIYLSLLTLFVNSTHNTPEILVGAMVSCMIHIMFSIYIATFNKLYSSKFSLNLLVSLVYAVPMCVSFKFVYELKIHTTVFAGLVFVVLLHMIVDAILYYHNANKKKMKDGIIRYV